MNWSYTSLIALLVTSMPISSIAQQAAPPPLATPTGIDREENNPAKAANKAKQAQQQDEHRAAADEVSATELAQRVEAALLRDARTAKLAIQVSVVDKQMVELRGIVPTAEMRAAAGSVATGVSGAAGVRNLLETSRK